MELTTLIKHPERMNRETLYELRSLVALYPYFQTARLLLLQNLYLLHDASFDEELRSAAIYITDRKVIFNLIEAAHYRLKKTISGKENTSVDNDITGKSRTISLIDNFLDSMPKEEDDDVPHKRKPTPADAAIDYVSYLLESDGDNQKASPKVPQLRGQNLIDTFLNDNQGRIVLSEDYEPQQPENIEEEPLSIVETVLQEEPEQEESYFTEALARIYIRQGHFQKAFDIIDRLSEQHPEKNVYFNDQKRFLKKLIINNNKNN